MQNPRDIVDTPGADLGQISQPFCAPFVRRASTLSLLQTGRPELMGREEGPAREPGALSGAEIGIH